MGGGGAFLFLGVELLSSFNFWPCWDCVRDKESGKKREKEKDEVKCLSG